MNCGVTTGDDDLRRLAVNVLGREKLLLMTDYDGTLVPIREKPELALPDPGILQALERLSGKKRIAVAVLSGRAVDDLKKLLPVAGVYLVGGHGAEFEEPGGRRFTLVNAAELEPVMGRLAEVAACSVGRREGFLLENKKTCLAVHFRLADPDEAVKVAADFRKKTRPLIRQHNLEIIEGKKVLEIRPRNINKGLAVKYLQNIFPEYYPVYFGDDTTDEDAFTVVNDIGLGVLVSHSGKPSMASLRLAGPEEVGKFLQILSAGS